MTMIELHDVTKVYRTERIETLALDTVDLTVGAGEFVAVMGPSGCGKTTLLNLIGLLDMPSSGTLRLDGEAIDTRSDRKLAKIRNRKIGFVFQSFHLIPDLKVIDNVEIPLLYRGLSAKERRRRALAALDKVGLGSRVEHFPGQLSGGQQQRVAVARALVAEPRILLADEPTGNLDSAMGHEILSLLERVNGDDGTTVVMVTHDQAMAERAHRTLRLYDGRQVA
jgi:putative ABC transport system ATP-binding protein